MDVLSFMALVGGYLWLGLPVAGGRPTWNTSFTLAAVALAVFLAWRGGITRKEAGIRVDNLPSALALYGACTLIYAGAVLLVYRHFLRPFSETWPGAARMGGLLIWALFQEFCLLSFMLNRLRKILGKDSAAVGAAALLFSLLHLPNPFLTLYTLGGGLVLGLLFVRRPNLPAAALAHAAASFAAGKLLVPEITGWMRVGPLYLGK